MKKITLVSTLALGIAFFGAASQAHADEVTNQTGKFSTPTEITIKDSDNGGKDPLDPTDPTQSHLTLESVPTAYNFTSAVTNKTYKLSTKLTDANEVVVFNDRTDRDWSVKAAVTNNKVVRAADSKEYAVDSFTVNGTEIAATGATGIVAKAAAEKTSANNTGNIPTAVTDIAIGFTDADNTLKTGDKLAGTVTYTLYNSINAK